MNHVKYFVHRFYIPVKEAMPIMILGMLIFFGAAILDFQRDNQRLLEDTGATVKNTEVIVEKQDETLDAIKQLSLDNKLTSKQLGDTIICMLLVPVSNRTTQTQQYCREQAINQTPASNEAGSTSSQPVPEANATPQSRSNNQSDKTPNPPANPAPGPLESFWQIITQPVSDILGLIRR